MKHSDADLCMKPSLGAGGKTGGPGENRKQAWTRNQMHISTGTENRTQDSLVQS